MNQVAMIWGAAGGIGHALAKALSDSGWTVATMSRHAAELESVAAHNYEADVASAREVQAAVHAAAYDLDPVNLWIYAAGDIAAAPVGDLEPDTWQRIIDANLSGPFLAAHYSLPLLAPDAHLIFVGAVNERLRLPGLSAYAAAKAGLEAFGEAFRKEERGRRVTVIRPVAVDTPLWQKVPMRLPKDAGTPETAAARILKAFQDGETGIVDFH